MIFDNDVISSDAAKALIAAHGIEAVIYNGAFADDVDASAIEAGDTFMVRLNYANGVRLHYLCDGSIDGETRCQFILRDLKGQCRDVMKDGMLQTLWCAQA